MTKQEFKTFVGVNVSGKIETEYITKINKFLEAIADFDAECDIVKKYTSNLAVVNNCFNSIQNDVKTRFSDREISFPEYIALMRYVDTIFEKFSKEVINA